MKTPFDAELEAIRQRHGLPALAVAAAKEAKPLLCEAIGQRAVDDPTPVTIRDAFHIGSCTKAMTASLIGFLVDKNKLWWQTELGTIFPRAHVIPGYSVSAGVNGRNSGRAAPPQRLPVSRPIHPAWSAVTIAMLLTHRSGLPERGFPKGRTLLDTHALPGTPREQRARFALWMLEEAPERKAPYDFLYSNVNYALLGAIAERTMGVAFEEQMQHRVFSPLGITTAGFGPPPLIRQHRRVGEKLLPLAPGPHTDNPPAIYPAGGVHLSPEDWLRFGIAHAAEANLIAPETFRWLHRPFQKGDYNGGWIFVERDWAGGSALTHGGSNTLNFATIWVAPKRGFALLAMTNCPGEPAQKACDEAIGLMIRKALG